MENRIDSTLQTLKLAGKTALVPYVTIGFPDIKTSEALAATVIDSGADMLELGIPFSDPLADGLTIQKTSFHALKQGMNISTSLKMLQHLRDNGVQTPLIFMGYFNPFLSYGLEKFVGDADRIVGVLAGYGEIGFGVPVGVIGMEFDFGKSLGRELDDPLDVVFRDHGLASA